MKRATLSLMVPVLFLSIFLFNTKTEASGLKDIQGHWAQNEIEYLIERGIISGYADDTFRPNDLISKIQATIIIGRTMGLSPAPSSTRFLDVSTGMAGSGFVKKLDALDVVWSEEKNYFRPQQIVTREISLQYIICTGISTLAGKYSPNPFSDTNSIVAIQSYYSGIVKGYTDGTFRPNEDVTRAQFSVYLASYMQLGN